jgi:hypothetical protein
VYCDVGVMVVACCGQATAEGGTHTQFFAGFRNQIIALFLFCSALPLTTMSGEDDGAAALPDVAPPSPQPELDKNYVLRLAEHWCVHARSVALRRIGCSVLPLTRTRAFLRS